LIEQIRGGWFKGKHPTVDKVNLRGRWLAECEVTYVGKATSLRKRIHSFVRFGSGKAVGHWGGRYVWQLEDVDDHLIAWKACASIDSATQLENELLREFMELHSGQLPFGNIAGPRS
jgi:hypothetical protein